MVTLLAQDVASFLTGLVQRLELYGKGLIGLDDALAEDILGELGALLIQDSVRLKAVREVLCKTCRLHDVEETFSVRRSR